MIALLLALPALALPAYTFNSDDGGLIASGERGQWEWGAVQDGPGDGGDSDKAWGTLLASPYRHDGTDTLQLPAGILPIGPLTLRLRHWFAIDDSGGDEGALEQLIDGVWTPIPAAYADEDVFHGESPGWITSYFTLRAPADAAELRLRFTADAAVATDGWYIDDLALLEGDPVPPAITQLVAPTLTQDLVGPYLVSIDAVDNVALTEVGLRYTIDGGATITLRATWSGGDRYEALVPGIDPGSVIDFNAYAKDETNETTSEPRTLTVSLPAPLNLACPESPHQAVDIPLQWQAPVSGWTVEAYEVRRDDTLLATVTTTAATVPAAGPVDTLSVQARFETPRGSFLGAPAACTVTLRVPAILALDPPAAYPGEALRIALTAQNLSMDDRGLHLEGAASLTLDAAEITTADAALLHLRVADDAPVGPLAGSICSAVACAPFTLRLLDPADQPRLLAVTPSSLGQGAAARLDLQSNQPWGPGPFDLDLGDGIVVEQVFAEGDHLYAEIVALPDAPIGPRPLRIDDGARLREGVDLRLRDDTLSNAQGCATIRPPTPSLAGLLLVLGLLRRKTVNRAPISDRIETAEPGGATIPQKRRIP